MQCPYCGSMDRVMETRSMWRKALWAPLMRISVKCVCCGRRFSVARESVSAAWRSAMQLVGYLLLLGRRVGTRMTRFVMLLIRRAFSAMSMIVGVIPAALDAVHRGMSSVLRKSIRTMQPEVSVAEPAPVVPPVVMKPVVMKRSNPDPAPQSVEATVRDLFFSQWQAAQSHSRDN